MFEYVIVGFPLYNQEFKVSSHLPLMTYMSAAGKVPDLLIDTDSDHLYVKYGEDECSIELRIKPGLSLHWIDNTLSLPSDDERTYLLNVVAHLPALLPSIADLNPLAVLNSLTNKAAEIIGLWPFKGVVKGMSDFTLQPGHHG